MPSSIKKNRLSLFLRPNTNRTSVEPSRYSQPSNIVVYSLYKCFITTNWWPDANKIGFYDFVKRPLNYCQMDGKWSFFY